MIHQDRLRLVDDDITTLDCDAIVAAADEAPAGGGGQVEDRHLADCYRNSLALAVEHDLAAIAFPSVSTGVYGPPIERACRIAIREVIGHVARHDTPATVTFCCFGAADTEHYREALAEEGIFL